MARRALEEFLERVDGRLFALRMIFGDTERYRELLMAVAGDPAAEPELAAHFETLPDISDRRREVMHLLEYLIPSSSSSSTAMRIKFTEESSHGIQIVMARDGSQKFKIEDIFLSEDTPFLDITPGVLLLAKMKTQGTADSKINHVVSVIQSIILNDLNDYLGA